MRLLHLDEQGQFVLTDFRGKPTPPYAILSHRWSNSEVLIEDVQSGTISKKEQGGLKLEFCAKQATKDGLQYFWIDTCCINRWDVHERSKAINSMFRWYKNATRCYVYLADVEVATDAPQQSNWEPAFRISNWFTRGWTLQELIAPVSVEFFSLEGQLLGDKLSLAQVIHEITNIPLDALRNCPLEQFTTSERERWIEHRETSEPEDIVYCLLGVLGISMPSTYGEGERSARKRLRAEIEAASSAPFLIPFSQNDRFVGRESQLTELEAKLFSNEQGTTALAIVGLGGTGKSQLALEMAHRTRQSRKDCSVFWIDASSRDGLYQSFASVTQKLSVPGCDDDQTDRKQIVNLCLAQLQQRNCLLIFDNAEDVKLQFSGATIAETDEISDYLPQSTLCSVVFTTTNKGTAEALASHGVVDLQELTPQMASMMLQNQLTTRLSDGEHNDAMVLLDSLCYLPLAIVQAAACINARGMTLREYQEQLAKYHKLAENKGQSTRKRDAVTFTLFLAMDLLRLDNVLAVNYLSFVSCVDRKDIALELLDAESLKEKEDAIKILDAYALITRRPDDSALDVHRLVHQALYERLQAEGQLEEAARNAIVWILWMFRDDLESNRSKWRRLLPHAQHVLEHTPMLDGNVDKLNLMRRYALALYLDGRYGEAEAWRTRSLHSSQRLFGAEHRRTLYAMSDLAATYIIQGRYIDAEELLSTSTEIMQRLLGDQHISTLANMSLLATTYRGLGRLTDTEKLQIQVLRGYQETLGDDHPDTLKSMDNVALAQFDQGRWGEASELAEQVVQMKKRVLGNEHFGTLYSMKCLASMYSSQGRYREAEDLYVQVLHAERMMFGHEHATTMTSMTSLGRVYLYQGRWSEAEKLLSKASHAIEGAYGAEHTNTLLNMELKSYCYKSTGRYDETHRLQVEVLERRKKAHGDKHPDTLLSMHNLALTLDSQERHDEAFKLMEECLELRRVVIGDQHPYTLSSQKALDKWRMEKHAQRDEVESGNETLLDSIYNIYRRNTRSKHVAPGSNRRRSQRVTLIAWIRRSL